MDPAANINPEKTNEQENISHLKNATKQLLKSAPYSAVGKTDKNQYEILENSQVSTTSCSESIWMLHCPDEPCQSTISNQDSSIKTASVTVYDNVPPSPSGSQEICNQLSGDTSLLAVDYPKTANENLVMKKISEEEIRFEPEDMLLETEENRDSVPMYRITIRMNFPPCYSMDDSQNPIVITQPSVTELKPSPVLRSTLKEKDNAYEIPKFSRSKISEKLSKLDATVTDSPSYWIKSIPSRGSSKSAKPVEIDTDTSRSVTQHILERYDPEGICKVDSQAKKLFQAQQLEINKWQSKNTPRTDSIVKQTKLAKSPVAKSSLLVTDRTKTYEEEKIVLVEPASNSLSKTQSIPQKKHEQFAGPVSAANQPVSTNLLNAAAPDEEVLNIVDVESDSNRSISKCLEELQQSQAKNELLFSQSHDVLLQKVSSSEIIVTQFTNDHHTPSQNEPSKGQRLATQSTESETADVKSLEIDQGPSVLTNTFASIKSGATTHIERSMESVGPFPCSDNTSSIVKPALSFTSSDADSHCLSHERSGMIHRSSEFAIAIKLPEIPVTSIPRDTKGCATPNVSKMVKSSMTTKWEKSNMASSSIPLNAKNPVLSFQMTNISQLAEPKDKLLEAETTKISKLTVNSEAIPVIENVSGTDGKSLIKGLFISNPSAPSNCVPNSPSPILPPIPTNRNSILSNFAPPTIAPIPTNLDLVPLSHQYSEKPDHDSQNSFQSGKNKSINPSLRTQPNKNREECENTQVSKQYSMPTEVIEGVSGPDGIPFIKGIFDDKFCAPSNNLLNFSTLNLPPIIKSINGNSNLNLPETKQTRSDDAAKLTQTIPTKIENIGNLHTNKIKTIIGPNNAITFRDKSVFSDSSPSKTFQKSTLPENLVGSHNILNLENASNSTATPAKYFPILKSPYLTWANRLTRQTSSSESAPTDAIKSSKNDHEPSITDEISPPLKNLNDYQSRVRPAIPDIPARSLLLPDVVNISKSSLTNPVSHLNQAKQRSVGKVHQHIRYKRKASKKPDNHRRVERDNDNASLSRTGPLLESKKGQELALEQIIKNNGISKNSIILVSQQEDFICFRTYLLAFIIILMCLILFKLFLNN